MSEVWGERQLGQSGPRVFPLGLGCMGMSGMYGATDDAESIRAIHAAIAGGVTLIDTGDFYGMGHNELLIGRALRELGSAAREKVVLSVKFGAMRTPNGQWGGFDGRPPAVKNFLAMSLVRLGVSHVDIYRPARLDDKVPIEDTIGAVRDMVKQGFVKIAGLSEIGVETARRAQAVTPISDVQLEYGLPTRGMETSVLPGLDALGIGTTAYGVLGRGLMTASPVREKDSRKYLPRFTGDAHTSNLALAGRLKEVAAGRGVTAVQAAIAWVLSRGETIVPILGSRTVAQVEEALGAVSVRLSADEIASLEEAVPHTAIQGTRYDKMAMTHLDSER